MSVDKNSSREAILRAIDALRNRHCDINPYSVASEANVCRADIVSSPEFMQLLEAARTGAFESSNGNGNGKPRSGEEDTTTEAKLREQLDHLRFNESELRQQLHEAAATENDLRLKLERCVILIKTLREQGQMLQEERDASVTQSEHLHRDNGYLQQHLANLKAEAENISKSVNIAWQQGYLAGQHAAASQDASGKSFMETLAEAADAATISGVSEPAEPQHENYQAGETYATEPHSELSHEDSAPSEVPFVADELPIPLDDPEVLNDPFTAKLLTALQVEGAQIVEQHANMHAHQPAPPIQQSFHPERFAGFDNEPHIDRGAPQPETQTEPNEPHFVRSQSFWDQDMTQQVDTMQYQDMMPQYEPMPAQHPPTEHQEQPEAIQYESVSEQAQTMLDPNAEEWRALQQQAAMAQVIAGSPNEQGEATHSFSAEELHSLFRNKYVRPDVQDSQEMKAIPPAEQPAAANQNSSTAHKKFVGTKHAEPAAPLQRSVPPDIRKAAKMLGVQPEEITRQTVLEAWKREMAKPGVHPDTGGDTEMAIYLNTAKDTLIRWVENQTPKLGKKFGSKNKNE